MLHIRSCRLEFVLSIASIMAGDYVMGPNAALGACHGNLIYCEVESGTAGEGGFYQTACGLCSLARSAAELGLNQSYYGIYFMKSGHKHLQCARLCRVEIVGGQPVFSADGTYSMDQVPNLVRSLLGLTQQFFLNPARDTSEMNDTDVEMN